MSVSAFLFDCDGTIFPNVEKAHEYSAIETLRVALEKNNLPFLQDDVEEMWKQGLGKGILKFFESYINFHEAKHNDNIVSILNPETLEEEYEQGYIDLVGRIKNQSATDQEKEFFEVRKGITDIFNAAYRKNIPVAIISNATQKVLEQTLSTAPKIVDQCQLIAGSDTIRNAGYGVKPKGGSYEYAADLLSIDLKNSVGIEDTSSGVLSLHNAGVGDIIFCNNHPIDKSKISNIFSSAANEAVRILHNMGLNVSLGDTTSCIKLLGISDEFAKISNDVKITHAVGLNCDISKAPSVVRQLQA